MSTADEVADQIEQMESQQQMFASPSLIPRPKLFRDVDPEPVTRELTAEELAALPKKENMMPPPKFMPYRHDIFGDKFLALSEFGLNDEKLTSFLLDETDVQIHDYTRITWGIESVPFSGDNGCYSLRAYMTDHDGSWWPIHL